jgi:VWFA-related protein
MKLNFEKWLFAVGLIILFTFSIFAQQSTPQPTPPDEPVRILTEEVHLNVTAQTESGRIVPNLKIDDLLVVEEGMPQTITSIKQIPANVLLLLDTGGNLNFAKNKAMTGIAAKVVAKYLSPKDTLAIMQYNDKVETIADWTSDFGAATAEMDKKLLTGKRSRFSEAINASIAMFKARPFENRHLVLISDGVETVADETAQRIALRNLLAANITVHVISYTQLQEQMAQKSTQRIRLGDGKTKPRIPPFIYESMLIGLSPEQKSFLKAMNEAQAIVILNTDNEMIRAVRQKREAWRTSEAKLQNLAEDTGGMFQAPEEYETVLKLAVEIAKAIDSNYVISYTPTKPIAESPKGAARKVRVSSHLNGVQIRSRQKIIVDIINP